MDIFLIKNKIQVLDCYPRKIKIGVISSHPAYFKLTGNGNILSGSLLTKGLNIIEIKSAEFFQNPGTYFYILVTKKNQTIHKIKLSIQVRFIDKFKSSKFPKKAHDNMEILIPGQEKNLQQHIGPLNPLTQRFENLDSINLFRIISELIKNKKKKSIQKKLEEIKSRVAKCNQMTIGFYPNNNENQNQPIYASVRLDWEVIPNNI